MKVREPIDSEAVLPSSGRDGAMMLYDWFKHITTLSLITLGGILGILQNGSVDVRPTMLGAIISLVAIAGILGFDGQNRLLVAELESKPLPSFLRWTRRLSMASYGVGVGAFLSLIVESVA
jgi:hypothetical protein